MKIKRLIKRELSYEYIEFRIPFISNIISAMKSIKRFNTSTSDSYKFIIHHELNAIVRRESEWN